MRTLFVTGVSGALGSHALPHLAACEDIEEIVGMDNRPLSVSAPKLSFTQGSWEHADFLALLQDVDAVVHLATPANTPVIRKLLDACEKNAVSTFVIVSSTSVYGAWRTNSVPLTEESALRPNPGFAYAVDLAEQERLVLDWGKAHPDTAVAVLRLAMVLGGGLEKALASALGGFDSVRQQDITRPVQFLHIDDAVTAIVFAVEQRLDGVYNVAPNGFTGDQTAREISGAPPTPALPRRWANLLNHFVWRFLYRSDFAHAQAYLEQPWVVSSDRLQAKGWIPSYTSEEALVAEATPTWWANLKPTQRRGIITAGVVGGISASTAGALGAAAVWTHRALRRR